MEGQIPIRAGQAVSQVRSADGEVTISLASRSGERSQVTADQVIAATGYRPDLRRLGFVADSLRAGVQTVANTAAVDSGYQTSVPGLYMIGPAVAPVFGPVMRFVYGSEHAASTVSRRLAATAGSSASTAVRSLAGAGR